MQTCVTVLAKVTVGVLTTVVPPAPAVAEPMFTTVVEPEAPPVPRFTVLVTPVVVAPVRGIACVTDRPRSRADPPVPR
ncbi:hypothetical protein C8N34_1357 [Gemmobacter caeni]|uniref:Secreted protein n=1 Tax=Gemmobacter caeni TaxID=589035 RepID=A0A2T6A960_9RHOB|nr:hypothetical protein C8N34_1357 [Gemmobacter caeni]